MGLGAVVVKEKNSGGRAVCYASRSLSSVEREVQSDRKGSAGTSAVTSVYRYANDSTLYGMQTFDLVTGHEDSAGIILSIILYLEHQA